MDTMDDSIIVDLHSKNGLWLSNVLKELLHNATGTLTQNTVRAMNFPSH